VGKCPHRRKMLITWLFVAESDQTKSLKATYRRVQTLRISYKRCKRVAPEARIYGQNAIFWQFWGLYSHIFAPINVKFGMADPLPRAKFHVYRATRLPCGAKNPFLDHWVKTIPAWLPVINITVFSSTAGAWPTIPTILGTVIEEVHPILHPLHFWSNQ